VFAQHQKDHESLGVHQKDPEVSLGHQNRSNQTSTNSISRYNSPILSDVTIVLPRKKEKKRKKSDGEPEDEREKIFAYKLILASRSSAFEKYFQQVRYIS